MISNEQTPGMEGAGLHEALEQGVERAQHVVARPGQGDGGYTEMFRG